MTTIACNKHEIAGDLQYTDRHSGEKWKGSPKVFKFPAHEATFPDSPYYVGFTGTAEDVIVVASFLSMPDSFPAPKKLKHQLRGLVLTQKGDIFLFDTYDKWLKVEEPVMAIGSGSGIAKGAMMAGATPTEAIKIAMKSDTYTGFGVKAYKV